jgi:hypothetical protein
VNTGTLLYTLNNPNTFSTSANDLFGVRLDISEKYVAVSAYNEDDSSGADSGVVYIFDSFTGALLHTLKNPNVYSGTSASDNFGSSVSLYGDYVVVGAPYEDSIGGSDSGVVYIFSALSGTLISVLTDPNAYDTVTGDNFGISVGIDNNNIIVGAWTEDDAGGSNSGKAYIFQANTQTVLLIDKVLDLIPNA